MTETGKNIVASTAAMYHDDMNVRVGITARCPQCTHVFCGDIVAGRAYNKPDTEKPPIGIMPKDIWQSNRFSELLSAIERYVSVGNVNERVCGWMNEANDLLLQIKGSATKH